MDDDSLSRVSALPDSVIVLLVGSPLMGVMFACGQGVSQLKHPNSDHKYPSKPRGDSGMDRSQK